MNAYSSPTPAQTLRQLFGDNRAEWPAAQFRDFFVEPTYLKKVESMRSCFLVGGRGTGKTTTLQSLCYGPTLERLEDQSLGFDDQEYVGILVRMNKNRVRAFTGAGLTDDQWARLFAHYFNLLVALEFVGLSKWLQKRTGIELSDRSIRRIAIDLGLDEMGDLEGLKRAIQDAISRLQIQVNNPRHDLKLSISMAESPLRVFVEALDEDGLVGDRVIFCCIDEYENLLNYQQAVLNTYVKHSEPPLSYKIGLRKNGLRTRETRGTQDLLRTPDDYDDIEIEEEGFDVFARQVAEMRLRYAGGRGVAVPPSLKEFLVDLPLAQEAELLGARRIANGVIAELASVDADIAKKIGLKPPSEVYFLRYWQEAESSLLISLAKDWLENPSKWETRLGNYGFASLFWLSKGAKGIRIRKYYCGERVMLSLAGGNIRYFLELLDTAISYEIDQGWAGGRLVLSAKAQTLAAREVGHRRLNQLEGLADHGPQLKRLVLGIGKVFFELARAPHGHAPEITSFVLTGGGSDLQRAKGLLREGVSHLAFEVAPRTKATSSAELRDEEYRLHRIFCAFFEISHRRKRRATFDAAKLVAVLGDQPSGAISALLEGQSQTLPDALPEQLAFFSPFYGDEGAEPRE